MEAPLVTSNTFMNTKVICKIKSYWFILYCLIIKFSLKHINSSLKYVSQTFVFLNYCKVFVFVVLTAFSRNRQIFGNN